MTSIKFYVALNRMDASSIFATGGASGIVGVVGFLLYRFFFSKHRITSRCCGRELSIETEGSTPKINPIVDEVQSKVSPGDASRQLGGGSRQRELLEGRDVSRVSASTEQDGPADKEKGQAVDEARVQEGADGAPSASGERDGVPAPDPVSQSISQPLQ